MSLAIGVVGVGRDHAVAIVDPVYPQIWIAARDGDAASVDEFVRVRDAHPTDNVESKTSWFGGTMDIDARGGLTHCTPLHIAALNGHWITMKCLLSGGKADASLPNNAGYSPLMNLCCRMHGEFVRGKMGGWLHSPADMTTEQGILGAMISQHGRMEDDILQTASILLDHGVNVEQPSFDGHTALHFAQGFPAAVTLLLKWGANTEAKCAPACGSWTPISLAILADDNHSVRQLVRKGANLYALDSRGTTPIEYAANNEVIMQLIAEEVAARQDAARQAGQ
jgi:hypothetical protein